MNCQITKEYIQCRLDEIEDVVRFKAEVNRYFNSAHNYHTISTQATISSVDINVDIRVKGEVIISAIYGSPDEDNYYAIGTFYYDPMASAIVFEPNDSYAYNYGIFKTS